MFLEPTVRERDGTHTIITKLLYVKYLHFWIKECLAFIFKQLSKIEHRAHLYALPEIRIHLRPFPR